MPNALTIFQEAAKTTVEDCLQTAPSQIEQMQSIFTEQFGDAALSAIYEKISGQSVDQVETPVSTVITSTLDMADATLNLFAAIEQYVTLTIPKMEDGNNFGVTVQLALNKSISDSREKIDKGIEEITKYNAARADALEKCKDLPSSTTSTTTTKGHSNNEGSNKEGPIKTQECKESGEEKVTNTTAQSPELPLRKKAVYSVDLLYFRKAKSLYQSSLTAYMMAIDFLDKNKTKIDEPKGTNGGGSAFSSMY